MNEAYIDANTPANRDAALRVGARALAETALIVVAAGLVPALMFWAVSTFGIDVPWADEWSWLGPMLAVQHGAGDYFNLFASAKISVIADLWRFHNEHRIFVPSVLAVGLSLFGGWSPKREELAGVAIVTLELAMVWRMLRETVPARAVAPAFAAASLLLFSLAQYENWTWGFQIAWFTGTALALASVFALTRTPLTWTMFGWGLASALGAAFSSAFGLASPIVGLGLLLARRDSPRRAVQIWVACTVLAFVVYALGGQGGGASAGHLSGIADVPAFAAYVLTYLGSLVGGWGGTGLAAFFGLLGLGVYAAALVRFVRLRRVRDPYAAAYPPWLGTSTFCVLNALVTSFGRVGWGPASALQSRYTTVTAIFWVSVVVFGVVLANDHRVRALVESVRLTSPARRALAAAFALLLALAFAHSESSGYAGMVLVRDRIANDMHALRHLATASDAELLDLYSPAVNVARVNIKLLTLAGLGPLAREPKLAFDGRGDEPGVATLTTFAVRNGAKVSPVRGPVRAGATVLAGGYAFDSVTLKPGSAVVALIDGKEARQTARYGLATPDLGTGLSVPGLDRAGYTVEVDTAGLASGRHDFRLALKTQGNARLHALFETARELVIEGGNGSS